jgi:hypothetical protein
MRNLIVFRGDYAQVRYPKAVCKNLHSYVLQYMKEKGIGIDVIFCTYPSDIDKLKVYENSFNPINIYYTESGQVLNFKESLRRAHDIYNKYDYIIFLRFDIVYKMNISEWDIFTKEGVILPYKERTNYYDTQSLYGDVIIVMSQYVFSEAAYALLSCNVNAFHLLHNISSIIQSRSPHITIHTIVDGHYQSNTGLKMHDTRLNPIYIQVRYAYAGADKHLYLEYLNDPDSIDFVDW